MTTPTFDDCTTGRSAGLGAVATSRDTGLVIRARSVRHRAFGSATVEAPSGRVVASNWLASITKVASMITTVTRNGASRRVPTSGASAISISRPSERYLTSRVDGRWPAIG